MKSSFMRLSMPPGRSKNDDGNVMNANRLKMASVCSAVVSSVLRQ